MNTYIFVHSQVYHSSQELRVIIHVLVPVLEIKITGVILFIKDISTCGNRPTFYTGLGDSFIRGAQSYSYDVYCNSSISQEIMVI